jgi:hypothetical protein
MGGFKYKDLSDHNYSYMHSLIDDIDNGKEILLTDKTKVRFSKRHFANFKKLINEQRASELERILKSSNNELLVDEKHFNEYKLTKIEKTVYSKGGGSGAGTHITRLSEMAVCVVLASYVHNNKKFNLDKSITIPKINNVLDLGTGDTKTAIEEVIDWLKDNPDWMDSVEKTAKRLCAELRLTNQHHFHRDSSFMNSLYSKFQELIKPFNTLGLRISGDKWNPSDIWIATKNKLPASVDSVSSLNKTLLEGFNNSQIIGVSLKKVGKVVNYTVYNIEKRKKTFKYAGLKPQISPLDSKDAYILTESGMNMQIRSFGYCENVQCELKGTSANNGKCGHGALKYLVSKLSTQRITDNKTILKMTDRQALSEIKDLFSKCFRSVALSTLEKHFKKKKFSSDKVKQDFLISKIQALQIAWAVKSSSAPSDLVSAIYGYAHSFGLDDLFEASVYAKVY